MTAGVGPTTSWPALCRPSRFENRGAIHIGITGTRPVMTKRVLFRRSGSEGKEEGALFCTRSPSLAALAGDDSRSHTLSVIPDRSAAEGRDEVPQKGIPGAEPRPLSPPPCGEGQGGGVSDSL